MKKSFGQDLIERLTRFTDALESGATEEFTCRRVTLELSKRRYTPKLVQQTRAMLKTSQALFAQFLGVSVKTVHAWEQGVTEPSDIARRFMDEIRADPEYWRRRFRNALVKK
jgi:putative transcriptional regulator